MKRISIIAATAGLMIFSACSKNDDGPGSPSGPSSGQAQLHYKIVTTNKSSNLKLTGVGTIQWTAATVNPRFIKFEAKQGTSEIEYKSSNTTPIDLMTPVTTTFGNFTIPAGTYNEIELKIQLDKNSGTPALNMTGQFVTSNNVTIPVHFTVNDFVELKTEQKNVAIASNASFTAITTFDLSTFTTGITESMIISAVLTNGTLEISSGSNTNLYTIILNNFRNRHHHVEIEHD